MGSATTLYAVYSEAGYMHEISLDNFVHSLHFLRNTDAIPNIFMHVLPTK